VPSVYSPSCIAILVRLSREPRICTDNTEWYPLFPLPSLYCWVRFPYYQRRTRLRFLGVALEMRSLCIVVLCLVLGGTAVRTLDELQARKNVGSEERPHLHLDVEPDAPAFDERGPPQRLVLATESSHEATLEDSCDCENHKKVAAGSIAMLVIGMISMVVAVAVVAVPLVRKCRRENEFATMDGDDFGSDGGASLTPAKQRNQPGEKAVRSFIGKLQKALSREPAYMNVLPEDPTPE